MTAGSCRGVLLSLLSGCLATAGIRAQEPDQDPPKATVPASADVRKAERSLRDLFKTEFRSKDPTVLRAFAKRLLEEAGAPQADAALHYVMLVQARDIAAKAQDLGTAFAAVDRTAELFEIEPFEEKLDALETARKAGRTPDAQARTAADGVLLAEQARAADQFAVALKALKEAGAAARAGRRSDVARRVADAARLTTLHKKEFDKVLKARKRLESSPDDAAANLTVGRWLVFSKGDIDAGLPHLAKGSDRKLAGVARLDAEGFDPVAVAAAWMKLAGDPAIPRDLLVHRASHWLRKAWSEGTAQDRERMRRRAGEILTFPSAAAPKQGRPPGWPGRSGIVSLDGARAWSGQFSAKLSPHPGNAAKQGFTFLSTEEYPVVSGAKYLVSVMALTEGTGLKGSNDIGIWIAFKGADPKPIFEQSVKFPIDTPIWTRVEGTFTAPPGARTVHVSFHMAEPEGTVWVDGTSLICEGMEVLKNGGFEE